jgi:hypothetical protein
VTTSTTQWLLIAATCFRRTKHRVFLTWAILQIVVDDSRRKGRERNKEQPKKEIPKMETPKYRESSETDLITRLR